MVPEKLVHNVSKLQHIRTRDDFIADVMEGIQAAPMAVRLTPHVLSLIHWDDVLADPIRRQFIPLKSSLKPDHPQLSLDSLHEQQDSPVPGLVRRYHDKALFLGSMTPLPSPNFYPNEKLDSHLGLSNLLSLLVSGTVTL